MIKETEHFIVDYLTAKDVFGTKCILPVPESAYVIKIKYSDDTPLVCTVAWNTYISACETVFEDRSLVDNILTNDVYKEFVKLLDELYYKLDIENKAAELDDYCK